MKKSIAFIGIHFIQSASQSTAFVPQSRVDHRLSSAPEAEKSTSQEYLHDLWQDEKLIEREIAVQETLRGSEQDLTKHLVTEMLETALEHVKVLEKEKAKDAKDANDRFEHAAQEERVLHEFVEDSTLDMENVPIVDDYVSSRLQDAEREELDAMADEDEALREYEDLRNKEANIKDLLRQIKRLEPWFKLLWASLLVFWGCYYLSLALSITITCCLPSQLLYWNAKYEVPFILLKLIFFTLQFISTIAHCS